MKITEHTPTGIRTRELTNAEIVARAKQGDRRAIKELVQARGGWDALNAEQKQKVTRLLFGDDVVL